MASGSHHPLPSETVALGPNGEVRVPAGLLHRLGWREGDKLVLTADEAGDVRVLTLHDAVHSVRGMLGSQAGERRLADELIEERRREAERE
jgi:bifunctional DNA-binding transcriptional regulator/antitoxin component of YhaV-PrlF toxin-antitoxin module